MNYWSDKSRVARPKVTQAFKALRKQGFFARQNFWCCSSCAWCAAFEFKKDNEKPIVFYNRQSNASFKEIGKVHLQFGRITENDFDDADVREIGQKIVKALDEAGLTFEWNGTADKTIYVTGVKE